MNHHAKRPAPPPDTIPFRVVRYEESSRDDRDGPSLRWTLSRAYEEFLLPTFRLRAATNRRPSSPLTIEADRGALRHWRQLTGDPPLERCDGELVRIFCELLETRLAKNHKKLSPNSCHRVAAAIQWMFDRLGPPNRRYPEALGLFDNPRRWPIGRPIVPVPPAEQREQMAFYTLDEIGRILEACRSAPESENFAGVPAAAWLHALVTFVYNTGLRIDTVMKSEWPMVGRDQADFITVPPEIFKRRQRRPPFCLNRFARAAIDSVRLASTPRLFPWVSRSRSGQLRPWPMGRSWLFEMFRGVTAAAGIPEHRRDAFTGLRAALHTWAIAENPGLAPIVAGHKSKIVTVAFYTHYSAVRTFLARVPQPGALRQKDLF